MGKNEEGRDMSKELIKRLRADAESTDDIGLCADAADRIEELERERDAFYMDYRMKCDEEAKDSALVIIERDQLRVELAAALAACKMKDDALIPLTVHREAAICSEYEAAEKALALRPDDSALKAWLGEPVSFLYKHNSGFGDGHFWSHRPNHNGVTAIESKALYAPKELK